MTAERGIVYTFYSFKGGVGRSMALANVAALLARRGKRVLIIDWDLEAPGLEKYFLDSDSYLSGSRQETLGVLDLVSGFAENKPPDWHSCLLRARPFNEGLPVSILTAGRDSDDYVSRLQSLNWEYLFNEKGFGSYLEHLREEWVSDFDFILVDSRTGITDIGGICTIHLPDILVLLFSANEQSVAGVTEVARRARIRYASLPFDRAQLLTVPVPSRFENITEYQLAIKWKGIFAQRLVDLYKDWLPDRTTASDVLDKLFIPNVPFWSFGEGMPVVKEGTSDPRSLGFAYDLLARLLENRLQWNESLTGDVALSSERSRELINQEANGFYESLSSAEQDAVKRVFLRLVQIGQQGAEDAKRAMPAQEIESLGNGVVKKLLDHRLLYLGIDALTQEPTIEIAHESLLRNWELLRKWIEEDRKFLIWRQDLNAKILEWEDNERDKSLLLSNAPLNRAERIKKVRDIDLGAREKEFIEKSIEEKELRKYRETRSKVFTYLPYAAVLTGLMFIPVFYLNFRQQQRQQEAQQQKLEVLLADQTARSQDLQNQIEQLNTRLKEAQVRNDELANLLMGLQNRRVPR